MAERCVSSDVVTSVCRADIRTLLSVAALQWSASSKDRWPMRIASRRQEDVVPHPTDRLEIGLHPHGRKPEAAAQDEVGEAALPGAVDPFPVDVRCAAGPQGQEGEKR